MVKFILMLSLLLAPLAARAQAFTFRDPIWVGILAKGHAAPANDITAGLFGRYSLAGNVNDSAGTNNGTAVGSPTYTTGPLGAANGAISLNGSSQYVSLGHPTLYDFGTGDFTFVIWFNTTSSTVNQMLFACDDASSGRQFSLDINGNGGNGSIEGVILNSSVSPPYLIYTSPSSIITSGTWYQVILVRSGNSPGSFHLYLNGVAQTFTVFTGFSVSDFPFAMQTTTADVEIGRRSYTAANAYFGGSVASASLYNRAFSPTEATNSFSYGPK